MTRRAIKMLFKRHRAEGVTAKVTTTAEREGYYDDYGDWVPPGKNQDTDEIELECAILPLEQKFIMSSGGTYTSSDRAIYLYGPLELNQHITYKDMTYKVMESLDTSEFSGVYIYTLKAVSPFARPS